MESQDEYSLLSKKRRINIKCLEILLIFGCFMV